MRFKKGFTLAEILIVLMVIGALATMTIPSLMKGVQEAQYKTAYKKAFNNIANIMATEKIASGLPGKMNAKNRNYIYNILQRSLSAKAYVDLAETTYIPNTKKQVPNEKFLTTMPTLTEGQTWAGWIIADDGLSYNVRRGSGANNDICSDKATINSQSTAALAAKVSCAIIAVDVNGLAALPNKLGGVSTLTSSGKTPNLDGDQFYIYIGSDGATAGSPVFVHTGRIMADLK